MVNAKVKIDNMMIRQVRKNPQQLELYGYASNIGFAPKTSKNLITVRNPFLAVLKKD
jgi:hypothetical protein